MSLKKELDQQDQGPWQIYSFSSSFSASLPLFYLYQKEGKISEQGKKIGNLFKITPEKIVGST